MNIARRLKNAFTLVELLTVIAIIAILIGLLFPAIRVALQKAEISKGQATVTTLGVAFRAYFTEYGRWPVSVGTNRGLDSLMLSLLTGSNLTVAPFNGNPRGLSFFEYKSSETGAVSGVVYLLDPWRQPFYYCVDAAYANQLTNPFAPPAFIRQGVLIWSGGPNATWNALGETNQINKDNLKSW
jgi:prepilin-type N-terminal cleavage/methylation domain-containing protein